VRFRDVRQRSGSLHALKHRYRHRRLFLQHLFRCGALRTVYTQQHALQLISARLPLRSLGPFSESPYVVPALLADLDGTLSLGVVVLVAPLGIVLCYRRGLALPWHLGEE
jgi:hypothetical protein